MKSGRNDKRGRRPVLQPPEVDPDDMPTEPDIVLDEVMPPSRRGEDPDEDEPTIPSVDES